jgi:hypothetical protein
MLPPRIVATMPGTAWRLFKSGSKNPPPFTNLLDLQSCSINPVALSRKICVPRQAFSHVGPAFQLAISQFEEQ